MSPEHLDDEPADELYGAYIDAEYNWRDTTAETGSGDPSFLRESSETDVDVLTGGAADSQ